MSDKTVYRSTDPEVLKVWHGSKTAADDWAERVNAFLDENGFSGRTIYFNTGSGHILGIQHPEGADVPTGWRVDSKRGYLAPRRATKEGKAVDACLDALRRPDPRDDMPGMPKNSFVSLALLTCGLELLDGALYATWSRPIAETEVDLSIWERVKLSEYYAAIEDEDEDAAAPAPAPVGAPVEESAP